jgi:hypothetical protein
MNAIKKESQPHNLEPGDEGYGGGLTYSRSEAIDMNYKFANRHVRGAPPRLGAIRHRHDRR